MPGRRESKRRSFYPIGMCPAARFDLDACKTNERLITRRCVVLTDTLNDGSQPPPRNCGSNALRAFTSEPKWFAWSSFLSRSPCRSRAWCFPCCFPWWATHRSAHQSWSEFLFSRRSSQSALNRRLDCTARIAGKHTRLISPRRDDSNDRSGRLSIGNRPDRDLERKAMTLAS